MVYTSNIHYSGFPIVGGMGEGTPPASHDFVEPPHQSFLIENPPSRKWFLEKNSKKSEIKTTLEKDGRNPTKTWFSHLKHSKFCKKSATVC